MKKQLYQKGMRRLTFLAGLLLLLTLQVKAQDVPSPTEVFGFQPGAD